MTPPNIGDHASAATKIVLCIAIGALCVIAGVLLGANWQYATALFHAATFKEFAERAPIVALIISILGLALTGAGLVYQAARSRFNLEIDLALKIAARWDEAATAQMRAAAARSLLRGRRESSDAVDGVIDFLEDVGFLVKRRAISARTAWQFFSPVVFPYHGATIDYRLENDDGSPETWHEFEALYVALWEQERISCQRNKVPEPTAYTPEDVEAFLLIEANKADTPQARFRWRKNARARTVR